MPSHIQAIIITLPPLLDEDATKRKSTIVLFVTRGPQIVVDVIPSPSVRGNVFALVVLRPNGSSQMCTNQLARLTSEMECRPVIHG